MLNKVSLIGNLGKDPEAKGNSGMVVFSLATSENWKDKEGVKQERVTWHNIVVFDKLADICQTYLKKGKQIYIEGRIQNRSYEADGVTKYTSEIVANTMVMLGSKNDTGESAPQGGTQDGPPPIDESDIPFNQASE